MRSTASQLERVCNLIAKYLRKQKRHVPSVRLLQELIEIMFYASMKSEESRDVICTLAFVDPKNPAGKLRAQFFNSPLPQIEMI
jgi:hypothetical protein